MKLNLDKKVEMKTPEKGDIAVFQNKTSFEKERHFYLIIEDSPNEKFTLLNLAKNNLMSTLTGNNPIDLVKFAEARFSLLELVDIIPAEEFELVRKQDGFFPASYAI